jgi:hypothetical protein
VPWPVEGETRRRVLAGADVPCPACNGRAWDVVHRPDERATVCHTCGWSDGGWTDTGPRRPVIRVELGPDQAPLRSVAETVAAAAFPVYGIAGEAHKSFGFSETANRGVTFVHLAYKGAAVEVRSTTEPAARGPADRARTALCNTIEFETRGESPDEELSTPARALRHSVRIGAIRAQLEATPMDRVTIAVDGRPTDFDRQRSGDIEAAAAELDDVAVVIVSRGRPLADLTLGRL